MGFVLSHHPSLLLLLILILLLHHRLLLPRPSLHFPLLLLRPSIRMLLCVSPHYSIWTRSSCHPAARHRQGHSLVRLGRHDPGEQRFVRLIFV